MTHPKGSMEGGRSISELTDILSDIVGRDRIKWPEPIDTFVRPLSRNYGGKTTPAATREDRIAREAAAEIEREEGYDGCADARLRGAYDGDTEHRIALAAIRLFHAAEQLESQGSGGSEHNELSPEDK